MWTTASAQNFKWQALTFFPHTTLFSTSFLYQITKRYAGGSGRSAYFWVLKVTLRCSNRRDRSTAKIGSCWVGWMESKAMQPEQKLRVVLKSVVTELEPGNTVEFFPHLGLIVLLPSLRNETLNKQNLSNPRTLQLRKSKWRIKFCVCL